MASVIKIIHNIRGCPTPIIFDVRSPNLVGADGLLTKLLWLPSYFGSRVQVWIEMNKMKLISKFVKPKGSWDWKYIRVVLNRLMI